MSKHKQSRFHKFHKKSLVVQSNSSQSLNTTNLADDCLLKGLFKSLIVFLLVVVALLIIVRYDEWLLGLLDF